MLPLRSTVDQHEARASPSPFSLKESSRTVISLFFLSWCSILLLCTSKVVFPRRSDNGVRIDNRTCPERALFCCNPAPPPLVPLPLLPDSVTPVDQKHGLPSAYSSLSCAHGTRLPEPPFPPPLTSFWATYRWQGRLRFAPVPATQWCGNPFSLRLIPGGVVAKPLIGVAFLPDPSFFLLPLGFCLF